MITNGRILKGREAKAAKAELDAVLLSLGVAAIAVSGSAANKPSPLTGRGLGEGLSEEIDLTDYEEYNRDTIFQAERQWLQLPDGSGPLVRLLSVDRYDEYGNQRCYVYRLPLGDPRPRGRHCFGHAASSIEFYAALPYYQWVEIVWPELPPNLVKQSWVNRIIRRAIRKQAQPWNFNAGFVAQVADRLRGVTV